MSSASSTRRSHSLPFAAVLPQTSATAEFVNTAWQTAMQRALTGQITSEQMMKQLETLFKQSQGTKARLRRRFPQRPGERRRSEIDAARMVVSPPWPGRFPSSPADSVRTDHVHARFVHPVTG